VKKRAPGRSAAAVELPVTACDPLDRIRVRDVGGSVGGGQLHGACPDSPLFSLYRRVTGAHQPLNGWGSPISSGSGRWAIQEKKRILLHGRWAMQEEIKSNNSCFFP